MKRSYSFASFHVSHFNLPGYVGKYPQDITTFGLKKSGAVNTWNLAEFKIEVAANHGSYVVPRESGAPEPSFPAWS